jgi:hypothetical protein
MAATIQQRSTPVEPWHVVVLALAVIIAIPIVIITAVKAARRK